jgi:hypothetical protein
MQMVGDLRLYLLRLALCTEGATLRSNYRLKVVWGGGPVATRGGLKWTRGAQRQKALAAPYGANNFATTNPAFIMTRAEAFEPGRKKWSVGERN